MTLGVIGTGFGRTGTDSMRLALNQLGFGPTHHMHEINANPDLKSRWRRLALGAPPDWEALFRSYGACVDWPSAFYWRSLIAVYPDARVVLTWRSADTWWTSFEKTILPAIRRATDPESLVLTLIADQVFGGRPDDRDHAIRVYRQNIDDVMATVPSERLLVHRLGDGWEPLCRHLGVGVPAADYPRVNSTADFQATATGT